jgi:hypothetical protein
VRFRKDHRLRVFENRVLRKIFVPKREEVTGARRDMLNDSFMICGSEQLHLGSYIH